MVTIKLRPVGKKKQRSYRIVVQPKRSKLKGRFVEDLGFYNPHTDTFGVNLHRAEHWLSVGAQPTDTVYNVLINAGVIKGPKRAVHSKGAPKEPE
jgi:small subunit ribosomal protein S16